MMSDQDRNACGGEADVGWWLQPAWLTYCVAISPRGASCP